MRRERARREHSSHLTRLKWKTEGKTMLKLEREKLHRFSCLHRNAIPLCWMLLRKANRVSDMFVFKTLFFFSTTIKDSARNFLNFRVKQFSAGWVKKRMKKVFEHEKSQKWKAEPLQIRQDRNGKNCGSRENMKLWVRWEILQFISFYLWLLLQQKKTSIAFSF